MSVKLICLLPVLVLTGCANLSIDTGGTWCAGRVVHARVVNDGSEDAGQSETRIAWYGGADIGSSDPHDDQIYAGWTMVETPSIPSGDYADVETEVPSDDCANGCTIVIEVNAGDPPVAELSSDDNTVDIACE